MFRNSIYAFVFCSLLASTAHAQSFAYERIRRACNSLLLTDMEVAKRGHLFAHAKALAGTTAGIHPNKLFLLGYLLPHRLPLGENESLLAWRKFQLRSQDQLLSEEITPFSEVVISPTPYSYPHSTKTATVFHVNFADPSLFQYWRSGLFAQDEIQVAEHPFLAAWQDLLSRANSPVLELNIANHEIAILRSVDRYGQIDTSGIYGNAFQQTPVSILERKTQADFMGVTHLISMAARRVDDRREGEVYARQDIEYHLMTAITAFLGARHETMDTDLIVHTGKWGTGAFGNNPLMIAMIQIFAAHVARVDQLVYNTFQQESDTALALQKVEDFFTATGPKTIFSFLDYMDSLRLTYGRGNGT